MTVDWTAIERERVAEAIEKHPADSGRCAALARVVVAVGRNRDEHARGRQIRPCTAARFVVPKGALQPRWYSHTFGAAHQHAVDALTGTGGCAQGDYLREHWEFPEYLDVADVDVDSIDPGIQDEAVE